MLAFEYKAVHAKGGALKLLGLSGHSHRTFALMKLMTVRNRQAKLHVIANRVTAKPDVTVKEFEAGIEGKLRCAFPHDPKVMSRSTMKGQPLVASDPKHRMVADLHKLCIELAGVPEEVKTRFSWRRARK